MSWEDIIKISPYERATAEEFAFGDVKARKVEKIVKLTEDNMDKFQSEDKDYVLLMLKMLKENYSENIYQGLKLLLRDYDIIGVKGRRL